VNPWPLLNDFANHLHAKKLSAFLVFAPQDYCNKLSAQLDFAVAEVVQILAAMRTQRISGFYFWWHSCFRNIAILFFVHVIILSLARSDMNRGAYC
jgi:hypothetical protein